MFLMDGVVYQIKIIFLTSSLFERKPSQNPFRGRKALRVFSLGKLQEKLKAHFLRYKSFANDPQLLEKDTAFNVEWFKH